jgi:hypothetical protein
MRTGKFHPSKDWLAKKDRLPNFSLLKVGWAIHVYGIKRCPHKIRGASHAEAYHEHF